MIISVLSRSWVSEKNRDLRRDSYEKGIGIIWGIDLYVVIRCL